MVSALICHHAQPQATTSRFRALTGAFRAICVRTLWVGAPLTLKLRGYSCFVQHSELNEPERGFVVNDTLSFSVDLRVTRHVEWSAYGPLPCAELVSFALLAC